VTPIIATVQKPVPKSDRQVLPSQTEADTPNPPESGSGRDFGAVLRAVADTSDTSRAGTDPRDAAETAGPARKTAPAEAVVAALPPADPTNAAAMLATILTAAVPAAAPTRGPASDAGGESGPPMPVSAAAASGRGDLSGPAGASAPASTAGLPAGTGSAPEAGPRAGQPEMARGDAPPPAPRDGSGLGRGDVAPLVSRDGSGLDRGDVAPLVSRDGSGLDRIPKVEVLDRAVHFKPVLPGAAPGPAISAAVTAAPADADAKLQPVRTDGPAPVAAKPERVQAGLPDLAAAASVSRGSATG
jgi:chemotaxis protein MotD